MKTALIAAGALVVGIALGILYCEATIRHLRKRLKELRSGREHPNIIQSITRFLFVTAQTFAILWVTWSYVLATYSTVVLEQPFPVEALSDRAILTILGLSAQKVVENIFEHNEGMVFGQSKTEDAPPDEGWEEGGVG